MTRTKGGAAGSRAKEGAGSRAEGGAGNRAKGVRVGSRAKGRGWEQG